MPSYLEKNPQKPMLAITFSISHGPILKVVSKNPSSYMSLSLWALIIDNYERESTWHNYKIVKAEVVASKKF